MSAPAYPATTVGSSDTKTLAAESGHELAAKAPDAKPSVGTVTVKATDGRTVKIAARDPTAAPAYGQTLHWVRTIGTNHLSGLRQTHQRYEDDAKTAEEGEKNAQKAFEQSRTQYVQSLDKLLEFYTEAAQKCGTQKLRLESVADEFRETQTAEVAVPDALLDSIARAGRGMLKNGKASHEKCLVGLAEIGDELQNNAVALREAIRYHHGARKKLETSGCELGNLQNDLGVLQQLSATMDSGPV